MVDAVVRAGSSSENTRDSYTRGTRTAVGVQFELHDHEQLEITFLHAISNDAEAQIFEADTYFFVPRNVGLNASNYSKQQFYGDVTPLIRLDAVPLPLRDLADPRFPGSPLRRLADALDGFR